MNEEKFKYCIDSSTLINISQSYPYEFFPDVWEKLDTLVQEGRLIAPLEVLFELDKSDDEVAKWARNNKNIFIEVDQEQQDIIKSLLQKYPVLAGATRMPPHADPWVISLAIKENNLYKQKTNKYPCAVVTDERFKQNSFRIPNICKSYNIECYDLFEFWRKENFSRPVKK